MTSSYSTAAGRPLTPRMVDVLAAAAGGESAGETAIRLGLSIYTIRAELRASRIRLGVPTLTAAAVLAARRGLV